MTENQNQTSLIGIGIPTILTILLVVILTIFSVLTFSAAQADWQFSQKNAQTVSAYYEADAKAEQLSAAFAAGSAPSFTATIPITENQSLYIRLERTIGQNYRRIAWRIITKPAAVSEQTLPVWTGETVSN